ncbi:ABC transporter substrate-binding protein [Bowdeniella nasicola]|uniref:ABC transporter substrate-binding protein n=2 Tax=Bowdeniella nasicola TaxID=208480 RepID=A0A1Q5Q2U8_9ACTO|nr:ABC transporter substrate-binding protein [Bowdeniella nasicola]
MAAAALALSACGSGGKSEPAATETDPNAKVTLTVATFNEFGYEDLFKEYMDAHPNVTIEHRKAATTDEARDNLNTRLAAGSGLSDIEAVEVDWLPELLQYADKFHDLSGDDVKDRWLDWKTEGATDSSGRLIGYGTDIGPEGVCYRSDMFEKAGLPTDREEVAKLLQGDWDTYFKVGKEFTEKTKIPFFDSGEAMFQGMINQLETPFENPDGTPIPLDQNKPIKEVYDKIMANLSSSAHYSQWSDDWSASFQKDGFATMLCPGWMLGVIEGNAAGVKGWDIANVFPGGGGNWGGSYLTVPEQTEHFAEARALAAWLTAPEQQVKAFKAKGTFPSQLKALEASELKSMTNEFFNNAPTGKILADRAAAVSVKPFKGPNYFAIRATITDAINRVETGTDTPEASWQKAIEAYQALGLD